MDGLVKLGAVVGAVALVSAIRAYHADDDDDPPNEAELVKTFVRERTAELIREGYEAAQAYAIANREAGTSTP